MTLLGDRVALEPISPALAHRIILRDERSGDDWHPEYPFADELDPLRSLAAETAADPHFTMYLVRRRSDGLAVGGFGFFGPPDDTGAVEFGYGLVPAARGAGLASEAVRLGLEHAKERGARIALADTDIENIASQRVLETNGLIEIRRNQTQVFYRRTLSAL
jgi:RimJ/RimL family protein N-acetyltransferase